MYNDDFYSSDVILGAVFCNFIMREYIILNKVDKK